MTRDRKVEGNEQDRKPMPERQKWVLAYAATGFVIWWVSSMPMQFYHPYCGPGPEGWRGEHYGPHLSTYYREALISGLKNSDIPYLEIGDRVLVPFVDPKNFGERKGGVERFIDLVLGDAEKSWNLRHLKTQSSAVLTYAEEHPESEIAELRAKSFAHLHGGPKLSHEEQDALTCEMTKRIVDPNLK